MIGIHTYGIESATVEGVYQSDALIDDRLLQDLQEQVAQLEDIPEKDKDWHPGSNNQVLDLVHPSLFCLVNGVSRTREGDVEGPCLATMGGGEQTIAPTIQVDRSWTSPISVVAS